jgi:hypothetical protein
MLGIFTVLILLQFLIVATHDLVDIPGWVMGSQVQARLGRRKVWLASLANSIFPGIAACFAIIFFNRQRPAYVGNYWLIYCSVALLSAVGMWYLPYFRGAPDAQKQTYLAMYAGTKQLLPRRDDNPRPNLFHMAIHVLFIVTFCLAALLWVRG